MAVPTNVYAGIAKYPLLAIPMFVLAGAIFDQAGVAGAAAAVHGGHHRPRPGGAGGDHDPGGHDHRRHLRLRARPAPPPWAASCSAPCCAPATPPGFAAAVTAAAGSTDILIPPSVAFIVYSVLVPSATVPALFVGGVIPGILACVMLIIPALFLSLHHNFGGGQSDGAQAASSGPSFKDASWALAAPVLILGGLRTGWFTPTEAAVMAVVFGLFVGFVIYRSLTLRDLFELLVESAETSAVILVVVGLASVFAWACSTLGIVDPITKGLVALGGGHSLGVMFILMVFLVIVGMFLDGISIFLIFCPLFVPIAQRFDWDLVWFGVLMTYNVALGQFTPPMAVNLMVSCRLSGATMEDTVRWDVWLLLFMFMGLVLMIVLPGDRALAAESDGVHVAGC